MVVDLGELYSRNRRGSRVASSEQWSPRCAGYSAILAHPGAEGAAHLYLLLDKDARYWGLLSADFGRVSTDVSAHGRLTINFHFFAAQSLWRW